MKLTETSIPEVKIIEPQIFPDARGYFCETYQKQKFAALGITQEFVQDNESFSSKGVLRGLHFQRPPFAQAKIVRVLEGEILALALDLRAGSPTFGQHAAVRLSLENHRMLYIPAGFAHGFVVLSQTACIAYKCDALYAPQAEDAIDALDKALAIDWLCDPGALIRSEKDARARSWESYLAAPCFSYQNQHLIPAF